MLKRLLTFFLLNILIVFTLSVVLAVLGVSPYLSEKGLSIPSLLAFSLVWGFGGAFISLFFSKKFAQMAMGVRLIKRNRSVNPIQARVLALTDDVAQRAGINDPIDVGIFHSNSMNAFATGRSQRSSMIALSTALIETMNDDELSAVIAHELSHIRTGDMVSMTLLQGTINAFVIFLSRVIGYAISSAMRGNRKNSSYWSFYIATIATEMLLMIPAMLLITLVSRKREFRADKGAAQVVGTSAMIDALKTLKRGSATALSKEEAIELKPYAAAMINKSQRSKWRFFATHPPIDERIAYLRTLQTSEPLATHA